MASFSEDGRAVAVVRGSRVTVHRLDGDVVMDVEASDGVSAMAYHAAVGRLVVGTSGGSLEAWEGPSARPAWRRELAHFGGQDPYVRQVSISDDGDLVASSGGEETMLWEASSGDPFGVPVSRDAAMPHAFSPDSRYLVVGPSDGGMRLWDVQSNSWLSEPIASDTGELTHLAYGGPEQLVGSTVLGSLVLLDFDIERWRRHACQLANRDLTVAEWDQYLGPDRRYRATCSGVK